MRTHILALAFAAACALTGMAIEARRDAAPVYTAVYASQGTVYVSYPGLSREGCSKMRQSDKTLECRRDQEAR